MLAVVFQHEPLEGPGLLAPALERQGFSLATRLRAAPREDWAAPLCVVLGGPMAAYQPSRHPFLLEELALLRYRLAKGLPTLGICLGAQLLAAAAGARVFQGGHGTELGIYPVTRTEAGADDPVFGALPPSFRAAHWHSDTWDDVPGGRALAQSARYPQAFAVGSSYGVQFHPELTGEALLSWAEQSPAELAAAGTSRAALEASRAFPADEPAVFALLDALAAFFKKAVR